MKILIMPIIFAIYVLIMLDMHDMHACRQVEI